MSCSIGGDRALLILRKIVCSTFLLSCETQYIMIGSRETAKLCSVQPTAPHLLDFSNREPPSAFLQHTFRGLPLPLNVACNMFPSCRIARLPRCRRRYRSTVSLNECIMIASGAHGSDSSSGFGAKEQAARVGGGERGANSRRHNHNGPAKVISSSERCFRLDIMFST